MPNRSLDKRLANISRHVSSKAYRFTEEEKELIYKRLERIDEIEGFSLQPRVHDPVLRAMSNDELIELIADVLGEWEKKLGLPPIIE